MSKGPLIAGGWDLGEFVNVVPAENYVCAGHSWFGSPSVGLVSPGRWLVGSSALGDWAMMPGHAAAAGIWASRTRFALLRLHPEARQPRRLEPEHDQYGRTFRQVHPALELRRAHTCQPRAIVGTPHIRGSATLPRCIFKGMTAC
jgi:hypothetical protein